MKKIKRYVRGQLSLSLLWLVALFPNSENTTL